MPRRDVSGNEQIVPSLFDRLTDNEPHAEKERYVGPSEQRRLYWDSVKRDLGNLLNCRRVEREALSEFPLTRASVFNFGIDDISDLHLNDGDSRPAIRTAIERAIRQFEPRLGRVVVEADPPRQSETVVRFHISAELKTNLGAESVRFDTSTTAVEYRVEISD